MNSITKFICCIALSPCCLSFAATTPKFSIVPEQANGNNIFLSEQSSSSVHYQVTNNTGVTRTLTINPLPGVTMNTGLLGGCTSPFTLAANGGSCSLSLDINGSQVPEKGIFLGPQVCSTVGPSNNTPSPFLCSQPSVANALHVIKKQAYMYLTNVSDGVTPSLVRCVVTDQGVPSDCVNTDVPPLNSSQRTTLNPTGTMAYIAYNISGAKYVEICKVNPTTGNVSACADSGAVLPNGGTLRGVFFAPSGTTVYLPISGSGSNFVWKCDLTASGTALSNCVNAVANASILGSNPFAIAINSSGTLAYVPNQTDATPNYDLCQIDQTTQLLTSCVSHEGSYTGGGTRDLILNAANTVAYGVGNNVIYTCAIDSSTGVLQANCPTLDVGHATGLLGIALNAAETILYVAGGYDTNDSLTTCQINQTTHLPENCIDYHPTTNSAISDVTLG